jgi:choline-sulfatase
MYYQPQMSPIPASCCQETYVTDRIVEGLAVDDPRPWFAFASFIGPHPPLAPPIPFNRMYDPDDMPVPVRGDREVDMRDEQIPNMNYHIWAEDINDAQARRLYSRYWGDISYIDTQIGRLLDAVEARPDADNTVIAFFTDHGDHMGDHGAWQKETFFEGSARIPFLLSWPARLPADVRRGELVALTDLVALATGAATGQAEVRDGIDLLGMLAGTVAPRHHLFGYWGVPGEPTFKIMVRTPRWKYIAFANGDRQQLFDVDADPHELVDRSVTDANTAKDLRRVAVEHLRQVGDTAALAGDELKTFPFAPFRRCRNYQTSAFPKGQGFPHPPALALVQRL